MARFKIFCIFFLFTFCGLPFLVQDKGSPDAHPFSMYPSYYASLQTEEERTVYRLVEDVLLRAVSGNQEYLDTGRDLSRMLETLSKAAH